MSPRKIAVVVDLVRGKPVGAALNILRFTKRAAAKPVAVLAETLMSSWTSAEARSRNGRTCALDR